jgi:threonine dehydrogenase-like Zn-dependent dehydrogenase
LASTVPAGLSLAEQVVVIGGGGARLEAATRLGATRTVALETTTPAERAALVREWTDGRGADVVVEATGVKAAFGEGTDLLADHGAYLVLGLYAGTGTVPLDPYRLTNRCLRVVGGLGATDPSAHRTAIRLARRLGGGCVSPTSQSAG